MAEIPSTLDEHRRICTTCDAIAEQAEMISIQVSMPPMVPDVQEEWGAYILWFCSKRCMAAWLDEEQAR